MLIGIILFNFHNNSMRQGLLIFMGKENDSEQLKNLFKVTYLKVMIEDSFYLTLGTLPFLLCHSAFTEGIVWDLVENSRTAE